MVNKKGGEKLISLYWFLIIILIASGIYLMSHAFYHTPYDVREIEANILAEKTADCLVKGGEMNPNLINEQGIFRDEFLDIFMKECSLSFAVQQEWDVEQYYLEVNIFNGDNLGTSVFDIKEGNPNWKPDCTLKEKGYKRLVSCVEKKFYTMDKSQKMYLIKITSMVRKTEQNVK